MRNEISALEQIRKILNEEPTGYVDQLHSKLERISKIVPDLPFKEGDFSIWPDKHVSKNTHNPLATPLAIQGLKALCPICKGWAVIQRKDGLDDILCPSCRGTGYNKILEYRKQLEQAELDGDMNRVRELNKKIAQLS